MRALPLAFLLLAASAASGQGRLVFEAATADLGRVAEGAVPSHTFRFTNEGTAPVRIARVDASCGCTTPSFTEGAVAPGGTGGVEVAYDSNGRPGPFEKSLYVVPASGDGVTLRVTGLVVPAFAADGIAQGGLTFDTDHRDVGDVSLAEPLQVPFRFVNTTDRPIRIERVEAAEGVEVSFPERPVFGGSVAGLFVMIDDPAALADGAGRLTVDLVLGTTDPERAEKRVRITGHLATTRPE